LRRYRLSEIADKMGLPDTIRRRRDQIRSVKRTVRDWEERDGKRYLEQDKPGGPYRVSKRAFDALFRIHEGSNPATVHAVANKVHRQGKRIDELEERADAQEVTCADMRRLLPALTEFLAKRGKW